jgi:hypothetical protein
MKRSKPLSREQKVIRVSNAIAASDPSLEPAVQAVWDRSKDWDARFWALLDLAELKGQTHHFRSL